MTLRHHVFSSFLFAFSCVGQAQTLQVSAQEQEMLGIETRAVQATVSGATGQLTLQTGFAPQAEWLVTTPVPGLVQGIFVDSGNHVGAGDPLIAVRSAEIVAMQRDFLKAQAEWTLQQAAWERDRKLNEAGSVSDRRWQETNFAYNMARAEYTGLRAQLQSAGFSAQDIGQLAGSGEVSPDLLLRAPADAVVLERMALLGDHLEGNEPLARLGQPGKLVLTGMLSRSAAAKLAEGALLKQKEGDAEAVLVFVASVIDPETQTVKVRAEPTDASGLLPGQLTRWIVQSGHPVLTVPASAIVKLNNVDIVFVATGDGFEPREVEARNTGSGQWLVLAGLDDGERIAVKGTAALKGMSIGMGGGDG